MNKPAENGNTQVRVSFKEIRVSEYFLETVTRLVRYLAPGAQEGAMVILRVWISRNKSVFCFLSGCISGGFHNFFCCWIYDTRPHFSESPDKCSHRSVSSFRVIRWWIVLPVFMKSDSATAAWQGVELSLGVIHLWSHVVWEAVWFWYSLIHVVDMSESCSLQFAKRNAKMRPLWFLEMQFLCAECFFTRVYQTC